MVRDRFRISVQVWVRVRVRFRVNARHRFRIRNIVSVKASVGRCLGLGLWTRLRL